LPSGHPANQQAFRRRRAPELEYIKVLGRSSLGRDRMLCIVEAAGETMLLGVTRSTLKT
jgi:flagellar biogenesis protein FliO